MTIPEMPPMVPLLVALLLLLLLVARRGRRPRLATPRRSPRADLRAMALRGAGVATISREMRMPHDVVALAVNLTRGIRDDADAEPTAGKNLPRPAARAAQRQVRPQIA